MTNETDVRLGILSTLLTTPHRDLDALWPVHEEMAKRDPRFYVRLAAWYFDKGVYAFDAAAFPIEVAGDSLEAWEKAFLGITADGSTSCGAAASVMRKRKQRVEQIVLVTDEEENTLPFIADELRKYVEEQELDVQVIVVRLGKALSHVETQLRKAGFEVSVFRFTGDYYALPNVIPFLLQPSRVDLVLEIMEHPLPAREVSHA
ncbi:hypothetical protein HY251_12815 [bacterium]|nr:hypothetical protein [bacterium]